MYTSAGITRWFIAGVRLVSEGGKSLTLLTRSRWDIMASVLRVAISGRTKTYIMRKCNLSYRQLQAYLEILLDKGLLEVKLRDVKGNPTKIFATTQRGQTFLKAYGDLKATL